MPEDKIPAEQLNAMKKQLAIGLMVPGIKIVKNAFKNVKKREMSFGFLESGITDIVKIPIVQRDLVYRHVSAKQAGIMIDVVQSIIKHFKWIAQFADCDDRAKLVSALFSLFFGLNSCGEMYCKVKTTTNNVYYHWANVIITSNGDFILYDVDNHGNRMIMDRDKPFTMGTATYTFIKARF